MSDGILRILLLVPVFLFSLCVHEFAHGWVAKRRGDNTAELAGRLTIHPLAHADLLGTLLLPMLCIYSGMPFFGWAKPVPVDWRNFKNPRRDMALVAAAGPLSNIVLAVIATGGLALFTRIPGEARLLETLQLFAVVAIQVNLMLAFFNILPVPPLDGFNVLQGLVPRRIALGLYRLLPYANMILIALLFTGGFRFIGKPAMTCFRWLVELAT